MINATPSHQPVKGNIKSLRRIRHFLKPYRMQIALALVALAFTSTAVLGMGSAIRYLVDEGLNKGNTHFLDKAFLVLLGVTALLAVATYARFYLFSWIGEKVVADVRNALFQHIVRMHVGFFETTRTGDLLSRITTDTTLLQNVVGSSVSIALRNMVLFSGGVVMLLITSPKLTGYVALIVPLVVIPIIMIGRQVRALSRDTQARVADINAHAEESISLIRSLQALSLEKKESTAFAGHVRASLTTAVERIRMRARLTALVISLVFGAIVTVLWIGGHDVLNGSLSGGALSSFIFYAVLVASSIGAISEVVAELQRAAGATERMMELLALTPVIAAPEDPISLPESVQGRIAFEHINFTYPARPDRPALTDFSLEIAPGETVALVGPSGAGKTTLFQLLLRFYDPDSGTVRVDGVPVYRLDPSALRNHIGVVPQDPVIFSASAFDNIHAGNLHASEEEVRAAAHYAACLEFIEKLPDGFHTHLGEKGVQLSGGQKQRLAIARAMVRNPKILLLDEATSALDAENEFLVQSAINRSLAGRTTLVIAHRLATVKKADRIIVMEEGRIEAIGTHQSLLGASPLYARLAALQFSHVA